MDAVKFFKERRRMCLSYDKCKGCPCEERNPVSCNPSTLEIETLVKVVEQWSQEHPQKTMIQDFFEKFPNAPRTVDGLPFPCPFECGYSKNNKCPFGKNAPSDDCSKCWFRPLSRNY